MKSTYRFWLRPIGLHALIFGTIVKRCGSNGKGMAGCDEKHDFRKRVFLDTAFVPEMFPERDFHNKLTAFLSQNRILSAALLS